MEQRFKPGDYLFYQLEAGFALIRLLEISENDDGLVWQLTTFQDLFPDVETIEAAIIDPDSLTTAIRHVALTNRAFESTQVAAIGHAVITDEDTEQISAWQHDPDRAVSDLSIRLLTGLR